MDLNQLLYHHQLALMNAHRPGCSGSNMVEHYARRLHRYRQERGMGKTSLWHGETGAAI